MLAIYRHYMADEYIRCEIQVEKEATTMSLFKQFKMDEKKQKDGVLIQYGSNADGSIPGFKVLRQNTTNQRYSRIVTQETALYRRQLDLGLLDNKTAQKISMRIFCLAVLVEWENVQDETGKTIVFNLDNAMTLFEALPELYDDLTKQSNNASLFREDTTDADGKNS